MGLFFDNFRLADFFDICFIAIICYVFSAWVRQRHAQGVGIAIVVLVVLYAAAHATGMYLTLSLFRIGLTVLVVSLVIVFQQDIRHAIDSLASYRPFAHQFSQMPSRVVDTVTEAVVLLARERSGALIVLRGSQSLDRHIRGGFPADAVLTLPLLHSIFDKHSQGHDGAAVVKRDIVEKFGAHLPLSSDLQEVGARGTRHTAALGLAERSDALVIVVSEETGSISIAENAKLEKVDSTAALRERLNAFSSRTTRGDPDGKGIVLRDLGWKGAAFFLAVGLWFAFVFETDSAYRTFLGIPVQVRDLASRQQVEGITPQAVSLTLAGPERALDEVDADKLLVIIHGRELRPGTTEVLVTDEHLQLPLGVTVDQSNRPTVRVNVQQYRKAKSRIRPKTTGNLRVPLEMESIKCEPSEIELKVPLDLPDVPPVETEPIDLTRIKESAEFEVGLRIPAGVTSVDAKPKVNVKVRVRPRDPANKQPSQN